MKPGWSTTCLCGLALLGVVAVGGCAGKPSTPPPAAISEATRLAQQAAQAQSQGKWLAAATAWERAGRQFQLLNQRTNLAVAWHNEGVCRSQLGEVKPASALLEQASELNQALGRTNDWWRNQIALMQLEADDSMESAAQRLNQLRDAPPPGDRRTLAVWEHQKARVDIAQNRSDDATASLRTAEQAFTDVNDAFGIAAVHLTQAQHLQQQHQLAEAEMMWRTVLKEFERLGQPPGIARALAGLGSCLIAEGKEAEGTGLLERAAQNLHILGLEAERAAVVQTLDSVASRSGSAPPK